MVFATGDTHGNFLRFRPENFPEQKNMTKSDYVIICGDFGGVWDGSRKERQTLDWLESLPFTVLFVSGNHENSDSHRPNISSVISGYKQPSKSAQSIEITGFIEKSKPPEIIFFYTLLPLTA